MQWSYLCHMLSAMYLSTTKGSASLQSYCKNLEAYVYSYSKTFKKKMFAYETIHIKAFQISTWFLYLCWSKSYRTCQRFVTNIPVT